MVFEITLLSRDNINGDILNTEKRKMNVIMDYSCNK